MRVVVAVFLVVCLFLAAPTPWIYYGLMAVSLYFTIAGSRWLLAGLTILLFAMLVGFAYAAQSIEFFLKIYMLIIPDGFNANWLLAPPQYLFYVVPTLIAIMVGALIFVGTIYRGWADFWLASSFTSFLVYIFFAMLLLNCFFVGLTLYTFLSTNIYALFVWELIFQWVPFFAALFIIYYFLGYLFDRPQKQHLTSREAHRHYLAKQRKAHSH